MEGKGGDRGGGKGSGREGRQQVRRCMIREGVDGGKREKLSGPSQRATYRRRMQKTEERRSRADGSLPGGVKTLSWYLARGCARQKRRKVPQPTGRTSRCEEGCQEWTATTSSGQNSSWACQGHQWEVPTHMGEGACECIKRGKALTRVSGSQVD